MRYDSCSMAAQAALSSVLGCPFHSKYKCGLSSCKRNWFGTSHSFQIWVSSRSASSKDLQSSFLSFFLWCSSIICNALLLPRSKWHVGASLPKSTLHLLLQVGDRNSEPSLLDELATTSTYLHFWTSHSHLRSSQNDLPMQSLQQLVSSPANTLGSSTGWLDYATVMPDMNRNHQLRYNAHTAK